MSGRAGRGRAVWAAGLLLAGALGAAGCAGSSIVPGALAPGQDVEIRIVDPAAVERWSVSTAAADDPVVLRVTGNPVEIGMLRIRVELPGGVVVARLDPPQTEEFAIALGGRAARWTIELALGERGSAPVRYRLAAGRPRPAAGGAGTTCAAALRARGISTWIVAVDELRPGAGPALPGLGRLTLELAAGGRTASAAAPGAGAAAVPHVSGGALHGDFAGLGCEPDRVQVNLWDTGRGRPPALVAYDAAGRRLCGDAGQPACPLNPGPAQWVTWSIVAPSPIRRLTLECDELFLSSVVIQ